MHASDQPESLAPNTSSVHIREMRAEEAGTVATLIRAAFQSQAVLYDDWTIPPLSETAQSVLDAASKGTVLVAESDGVIVGSARGTPGESACTIGRLVVQPEMQGNGIGRALVRATEAAYPLASRFDIFTGHLSTPALRLYESLGYRRTGENRVSEHLTLVYLSRLAKNTP